MQLTRFDRWLREKYVHETHIYTMRLPVHAPPGARYEQLPEKPDIKYRHCFILTEPAAIEHLLTALKDAGQMFTTRVVDREAWYVPLLAPANNRSVTWWIVNKIVMAIGVFLLVGAGVRIWENPEMRENILDMIKLFKG
jgi:hypothetical protein